MHTSAANFILGAFLVTAFTTSFNEGGIQEDFTQQQEIVGSLVNEDALNPGEITLAFDPGGDCSDHGVGCE
jgi:hypothetical protein